MKTTIPISRFRLGADKATICSGIAFIMIGAGVLALLPMPAATQPLLYANVQNLAEWAPDGSGGSKTINTGDITTPNPFVETLTTNSSYSASIITVSATYGLLQASGNCSVGPANPASYSLAYAGFSANSEFPDQVGFEDCCTITSTSLASGTPVKVMVTDVDTFQGTASQLSNCALPQDSYCEAYVDAIGAGGSGYKMGIATPNAPVNSTQTFSETVNTEVGARISISDNICLQGGGNAAVEANCDFQDSASGSLTSKVYVNVLTLGASYASCSGTVYTQYHPPLQIVFNRPGLSALLFWLDAGTNNYTLEECTDISRDNWITNGLPLTFDNGTNEVTIPLTNNAMFFRLIGQ